MRETYRELGWEITIPKFLLNSLVWVLVLAILIYGGSKLTFINQVRPFLSQVIPIPWISDYADFFLFIGISLLLIVLFKVIILKRLKLVSRSIILDDSRSKDFRSTDAIQTNIKFPAVKISTIFFYLIVGGFLVNQLLMNRLGVFSEIGVPNIPSANKVVTSSSVPAKLTSFDLSLEQNIKSTLGALGSQHIHADFKVYVNGQALDFSDKDHMGRMRNNLSVSNFIHVDSGSPTPEKTGDILHMHATKVPLELFFRSIGMKLEKDRVTLTDGQVLKNENGNTLKFYLNGKKVDELGNYVFQPLDKLLISFGSENDPSIQTQINSVANFAKDHQK